MTDFDPLLDKWRQEAALYEQRGMTNFAVMARSFAEDLELFVRVHALEALTLEEASRESGYSRDHLSRMISEGRLENIGGAGQTRLARGSLPKKPPKSRAASGPDLVGMVRAAEARMNGDS